MAAEELPAAPRHVRWFAVWLWSRWLRITLGVLVVMGAATGLVLWGLWALFPVDVYIHDVYITVPKLP